MLDFDDVDDDLTQRYNTVVERMATAERKHQADIQRLYDMTWGEWIAAETQRFVAWLRRVVGRGNE